MAGNFEFGGSIVWHPSPSYTEDAHLTRFMRRYGVEDFAELMKRSTQDVAWFTNAVLEYLDIRFYQPYTQVIDLNRGIAWPGWCIDGKLNIISSCLEKYIGTANEKRIALISETEEEQVCHLTYGELWRKVNQAANGLRQIGLGKGDVIGLFMPMTCEIVIAFLAIAKIGGIILPLFSGYGSGAVASRLADANGRALFTADGFQRRGIPVLIKPIADEAALAVPTLQHMIVLNHLGSQVSMQPGRDHDWDELISSQPEQAVTEITAAEDILMLIYTSGTSGRPKGAVHTHCGFPVKAAQDMAFGTDVGPGQVIYWMTDMGWMMGPWLVFGSLILGGTLFIYEGAPDHPGSDRLWEMVERHHITTLGVSPTLIRTLIPHGNKPHQKHDLSSLRFFASTGEPWNPDSWLWLFEQVGGSRRPIINYSGGTEISGGIVMGNPLLPLKPCAFSAPCPGIAADVFNEKGESVRGQVGELVIKAPWIGMTRGFWKDAERYIETYWSTWPDIWVHGDFAVVDEDGFWFILGRSDDTIKIAGKRLGPAEVESIVIGHPAVIEAAAIGIPNPIKGSELIVFCVLKPGAYPSEALRQQVREMIIKAMGRPLAPRKIIFVADLPKTRNAKVMRRIIRSAYLDQDPGDTSSLVNPAAVEEIRKAR